MIVEIELDQIIVPQGMLPRVITGTVQEKVQEYAEMLEQGVEFDPIVVWKREDGYWIVDGMHRVEAHRRVGRTTIRAKLVELKDELEYRKEAIKANLKHGLPLMREERIILAQTLYKLGVSQVELQKLFGVSERTLYYWLGSIKVQEKEELKEKVFQLRAQGLTQEEVAKELGIPQKTISNWENVLAKTAKIAEMAKNNETQSQKDEPNWELLEQEWKRLKEEGFWDQDIDEIDEKKKKGKVGRPRKEEQEDTRTEEERIKDEIVTFLASKALTIGWKAVFKVLEEARQELEQLSRKSVRGW